MKQPLVSVIIPTYNEEGVIAVCIESLKRQIYKALEIIVVDDGSQDKTKKILKSVRGIRFIKQDHNGPGAARNKGAKKAKGDILVFIDADMTFSKRFIDKLTKPIREGKAIGSFSKEEFVSNAENKWARFWSIYRGFREGRMHPTNHPDTQKVFRAILKEKFNHVGGFTENVGYTDDWTISEKLGVEAVLARGAVFYHNNPATISEAFTQARWMSKRPYKLGIIGRAGAMVRVSLPFSLVRGTLQAIRHKEPAFIIYRLVVDFAQYLGMTELLLRKKRVK